MDEYLSWKNDEGLTFDPWIRVHVKFGGKITGICSRSMIISGTLDEWQSWSGLTLKGSGNFYVDKALSPVTIDEKTGRGNYAEPNVWIVHGTKNPDSGD